MGPVAARNNEDDSRAVRAVNRYAFSPAATSGSTGDPGVLAALAVRGQPATADVDIGDLQGKDLAGAQPAVEHQPGHGQVPAGA